MSNILLYDCIIYNGESVLELRLRTMYESKCVDRVFVTESRYTFSGIKKEFLYLEQHREMFEKYGDWLHRVIIDEFPQITDQDRARVKAIQPWSQNLDAWFREFYQRDYARDVMIQEARKQGKAVIAMVCDTDEIVDPLFLIKIKNLDMINRLKEVRVMFMQEDCYTFEWWWKKSYVWMDVLPFLIYMEDGMSDITTASDDLNIQNAVQLITRPNAPPMNRVSFNQVRLMSSSAFRNPRAQRHLLPQVVWHLSSFLTDQDIQRKLQSFSHSEINKEEFKNSEWLNRCRLEGCDLLKRDWEKHILSNQVLTVALVQRPCVDQPLDSLAPSLIETCQSVSAQSQRDEWKKCLERSLGSKQYTVI